MTGATPLEHMALMDHPQVRTLLLGLIAPDQAAQVIVEPGPPPASIEDYEAVKAQIEHMAIAGTKRVTKEAAQAYLEGLPPARQQALARRWFIELPKGAPPSAPYEPR